MSYHVPVLLQEAVSGLRIKKDGRYIDATFGGGGHSLLIQKSGGLVLGIDVDPDTTGNKELLDTKRFTLVLGNFSDIEHIAKKNGFDTVDGILFDLGVSSHQLDTKDRGFSYRFSDSELDLRLNQSENESAKEYIAKAGRDDLSYIFATYGEESMSDAIAEEVVKIRRKKGIDTTGDLYDVIKKVVGKKRANEVASRIFQALRMYINNERENLKKGLEAGRNILRPGGRMAVISFHSLEDRTVKQFFAQKEWKMITRRPITVSESEYRKNKRSRSSKLRIAEKL